MFTVNEKLPLLYDKYQIFEELLAVLLLFLRKKYISDQRKAQFSRKTRLNKFENESKKVFRISQFHLIKEVETGLKATKRGCRAYRIRLVQSNHILQNALCFLQSMVSKKFLTKAMFFSHTNVLWTHATHQTYAKMLTQTTHAI